MKSQNNLINRAPVVCIFLSNEVSCFRNRLHTIKLLAKKNLQTTQAMANLLVTLHKMTGIAEDNRYRAANTGVKLAFP